MKREIIFRGKRTFCNEWVYGDLGHYPDRTKIDTHENGQPWRGYDVFPETVGQFTGLIDKNGKKIFEGDILLINDTKEYPVYVAFTDFRFECRSQKHKWYCHPLENSPWKYEVIGNIHDNPELLEGGVENG